MKILRAKLGYTLHNKETDEYMNIVYLPDNADTSIYEQVRRKDVDRLLYESVEHLVDQNNEQDEILNITMMATDEINTEYSNLIDDILVAMDELYCMIEPILNKEEGGNL